MSIPLYIFWQESGLGNSHIYVFPNERKSEIRQPDYYLTLGQRIFPDDWKGKKDNGGNKLIVEVRHTHGIQKIKER